jgi:O-antigen/teichoic acid export membrane protein
MSGSSVADALPDAPEAALAAAASATPAAPDAARRGLRRDVSVMSAVKIATVVLMVVQQALLARALGPAAKGVVDFYLLAGYAVTEFGSLGIASGIVFTLTRRDVEPGRANGVALRLAALLGVAAMLVLLGYGWMAAPGPYVWAAVFAALAAPAAIYLFYWTNLVTALGQAPLAYLGTFATAALSVSVTGALWAADRLTPATAAAGLAASTTLVALVAARQASGRWGCAWDRPLAGEMARYASRMYPGHVANVVHYRLDQYVVGVVLGPAALGLYALAARISEVFWYLDGVVIAANLSRIATLPVDESWRLTRRIAGGVALAGAAGVAGAWLLAGPVVRAVFGAEFAGSAVLLVPLLTGAVAWSLARVLAQHLSYRLERPVSCTTGAAAAAALNGAAILFIYLVHPEWLSLLNVALVSMFTYSALPVVYLAMIVRLRRAGARP